MIERCGPRIIHQKIPRKELIHDTYTRYICISSPKKYGS